MAPRIKALFGIVGIALLASVNEVLSHRVATSVPPQTHQTRGADGKYGRGAGLLPPQLHGAGEQLTQPPKERF